ncbi:DUF2637 domain-containing protein [Streptomyces sp. NBC_00006]|uniref:DUF2637 domain-containing protein n=1 Tax=Streptomyces sp. NBC_00006 TaxID=2975619 RepID=UPI002253BA28|nr:DUF2637 domain-containing protein [Streptomyces sp. NBC_00006]MCX5532211.1 DUF2637 domain-containing protein [Streptomyces sp. NBC_00006]
MTARTALRPDAVLVQAVIAGALSFAHLHDLAAAAGQDGWKAWAYPVSVDLLLVAAWRRLRSDRRSRLAWTWFAVALFASLGANVATAGLLDVDHPPAWLRIGVAGWPAIAFLGGTLLAHTATTAPAEVERETVRPAPEPEPEFEQSTPPAPEPVEPPSAEEAPALTAATEPAAPPPAEPVPAVPAALVAHARKVADAHQARTGNAIDPDTLRSRLGVPPQLADAIAAQLT